MRPIGLDPRAIVHRLELLPERAMRAARLGDWLQAADSAAAAWLLETLATAGRGGGPPYAIGLLAAVDLLGGDAVPIATRQAIHQAAQERGLHACCELLHTGVGIAAANAAAPRALVPGGRPMTLGERKALARTWRRELLVPLLDDPHVDVVRRLVDNPHVTEDDILRIATARRSPSAVLGVLLRSHRWSRSPRIRRALVRNPRLPPAIAVRLLGLLSAVELRDISSDAHLPGPLRAAVDRRLRPPS